MNSPPRLKTSTPEMLVENVLHLVSLPEIYLRLQQVLDDPHHTRMQVAEVVAYDPSLSARVLRIANSSYYGFPNEVDSISTAVNIIGEIELRNIVLATTVVNTMSKLEQNGLDINQFWLHSVLCGVTARLIAREVGGCNPENLFLCGMLHDLGILILYRQEKELANSVAWQMHDCQQSRHQAEQVLLGFDHARLGGLLAQAWGLTPLLQEVINCHHQPTMAVEYLREAQILCLANLFAQPQFEIDNFMAVADQETRKLAETLAMDFYQVPQLIENARLQSSEIQSIICG